MFAVAVSSLWLDMFGLHLSASEKILRSVIVYVFLVVALRIFGKRELAQLNPFDLVVLLTISNTVQNAIIGDDNSVTGGLLGALSLFAINYLVVRFVLRHRRLDQILQGEPSVLIHDGAVDRAALAKELLSESELAAVAHRQGIANLDEIDRCVLEPGGVFSIQRKAGTDQPRASEILAKLDQLGREMEELKSRLPVA
jgi:uncharacterized membrane protein YcaP (DUF421 family)